MGIQEKSSANLQVLTEPLWKTSIDPETKQQFWTDLETGKICYQRPINGTFVSETSLRVFRQYSKKRMLSETNRPKHRRSFVGSLLDFFSAKRLKKTNSIVNQDLLVYEEHD